MRLREHYERAFAWFLRENRVPFISVDEARRTLLPHRAALEVPGEGACQPRSLKNFDVVAYTDSGNYLVDIKGRKVSGKGKGEGRLESWVTRGDVDSLAIWESLFNGDGQESGGDEEPPGLFRGAFVFLFWLASPPPDGLFQEIFVFEDRWYAVRSVELGAYAERMKVRSPSWKTVDLRTEDFRDLSRPFFGRTPHDRRPLPTHESQDEPVAAGPPER